MGVAEVIEKSLIPEFSHAMDEDFPKSKAGVTPYWGGVGIMRKRFSQSESNSAPFDNFGFVCVIV